MPDMLFILLLALVLLGPKKLPQVAAQIGKYLVQFQRMRRELLDQVNAEVARMETSQAQLTAAPVPAPHPAPSPALRAHFNTLFTPTPSPESK
jgi:sec-independent protein translocase protein TatB